MSRRPNERALLLKKEMTGLDPLVDEILKDPEGDSAKLQKKAEELNQNPLKKRYVEACLLCSDNFPRMAEILEMDLEVITTYYKIYFDITGFDRVEKLDLADVRNTDESQLKMWALAEGLEFIAWRLGHRVDAIAPVEGLRQLYSTCLYKAKEAFFSGNASKASQESAKWTKLSMDIARLLKSWTTDNNSAQTEIDIKIREVKASFPSVSRFTDLFDEVKLRQSESASTVEIPTSGEESSD